MKRLLMVLAVGVLMASPALAQEAAAGAPRAEVFGGFSYNRVGISNGLNMVGWQASPDINFNKYVSLATDFGGQYKSIAGTTLSLYEYMAGPRFKYRTHRLTCFAQTLAGGAAAHADSTTLGAFAVGFGGGLDVNVSKHVAIRAFQIDSIHTRRAGEWNHELREGFGVVFKLGGN